MLDPTATATAVLIAILAGLVAAAARVRWVARERAIRAALGGVEGESLQAAAERVRRDREAASASAARLADDLQALADAIPVGVLRLDGRGRVELANAAAREMSATRGALVGLSAMEVFTDHRVEAILERSRMHGSAAGELAGGGSGDAVRVVGVRRGRDGTWVTVEDVSELPRL